MEAFDWFAANNGTGSIYIAAKADAAEALYVKNEAGEYVEVDVAGKTDIEVMNEGLLEYQTKKWLRLLPSMVAAWYTMCLSSTSLAMLKAGENKIGIEDEGYYGVVRNHWYTLSIGKIVRVGHGIFNPGSDNEKGEEIIPDEPEDPQVLRSCQHQYPFLEGYQPGRHRTLIYPRGLAGVIAAGPQEDTATPFGLKS